MSVHGSTPYNSVYGRVPHVLPDVSVSIDGAMPGAMRHAQRTREVSVQAMVEGAVQARVKRSLGTKTRQVGQGHNYKIGGLVDLHRASSTKDARGRKAPVADGQQCFGSVWGRRGPHSIHDGLHCGTPQVVARSAGISRLAEI